jgi:hypothetical protein
MIWFVFGYSCKKENFWLFWVSQCFVWQKLKRKWAKPSVYALMQGGKNVAINLDVLLIDLVVKIIVLAPAFWLAGRVLAGEKAKFLDAVWIVILGTLVGGIFSYFEIIGIIALIIQLIIWLGLVKHFFDTDWIPAFVISVLAVIIIIVVGFILGLVGIGIGLLLI